MSLYRVVRNPDTNEKDLEVIGGTTVQPGCPVGTILAYYGSVVPTGYLPCNGTTFDETQFPNLYLLLGTNVLPDLRECTLVGIGENTTDTIGNHDIYTIGEFKDDQVQDHTHHVNSYAYASSSITRRSWYNDAGSFGGNDVYTGNPNTGRHGDVTRGKSKGVNYIIKAVSNVAESEATAVFDQLKTYVESYTVNTLKTLVDGTSAYSDYKTNVEAM